MYWPQCTLFVVALFSQNAVILILELLVEWGGDVFAPMKEGGLLVFGTNQTQRGLHRTCIVTQWVLVSFMEPNGDSGDSLRGCRWREYTHVTGGALNWLWSHYER